MTSTLQWVLKPIFLEKLKSVAVNVRADSPKELKRGSRIVVYWFTKLPKSPAEAARVLVNLVAFLLA